MARKLILTSAALLLGVASVILASGQHHSDVATNADPLSADQAKSDDARPAQHPVSQAASVSVAVPNDRVAMLQSRWEALAQKVRSLDSTDQSGLDRLYAEARAIIQSDPKSARQMMERSVAGWAGASFEESFFAVSAWIRYSSEPAQVMQALWQYDPPVDPLTADVHHLAMTPAIRYDRVQAYGLRELRKQLEQGHIELGGADQKNLVQALVPRAMREQSLDVSLEMFQLLSALKETQGIQTALSGHSARDQELIQGVLAAN